MHIGYDSTAYQRRSNLVQFVDCQMCKTRGKKINYFSNFHNWKVYLSKQKYIPKECNRTIKVLSILSDLWLRYNRDNENTEFPFEGSNIQETSLPTQVEFAYSQGILFPFKMYLQSLGFSIRLKNCKTASLSKTI